MEGRARRGLKRSWSPYSNNLTASIISISDLQSQHVPCCSCLTWSSDEFRKWICQNEVDLPDQKHLEQTHLILIGYLTNEAPGIKDKIDGNLYLRDNTGVLPCVFLNFKLEWLEQLLLFCDWIYIPQMGQGRTGYLEILADPIHRLSGPEKTINVIPVFYPVTASKLLSARHQNKKMQNLNVAGELVKLSTVLYIHQKYFFFLFLKCFSSAASIPVVVENIAHMVWLHALQLGHKYVLTDLKISCLKSSRQRIFKTTCSSYLLPYHVEQAKEQFLEKTSEGISAVSVSTMPCPQLNSLLKLQEEEKMHIHFKKSKIISYRGTITRVLNGQAGLYELDNQYILCLAYLQRLNFDRGFRPGAYIELQDVHLMEKPLTNSCSVLGACLQTTIVLKNFSSYSILHQPVTCFGNHYLELLTRYNLSLSFYLFMVSLLEIFEQRFSHPQELLFCFNHQSQGPAEKFIVSILNSMLLHRIQERNLYLEILAEKHHCPLEQYQILEPPCQIPHFAQLHTIVEKSCWKNSGQFQKLGSASEICNQNIQELNHRLAWSFCILSTGSFQPPLVLLGVLEFSSNGSLRLQDRSKGLPCVILHKNGRPFTDVSLIGCLLHVRLFQLIMERFLQNNLSSQQLSSTKQIKAKQTRLYAQFYFEDVEILHTPELRGMNSVKKSEKEFHSEQTKTDLRSLVNKVSNLRREKANTRKPEHITNSTEEFSCVSRQFLVIQKEGLAWRNYFQNSEKETQDGQTAQLCFQATVLWMGQPKLCSHLGDSKGQQELKTSALKETSESQQKLTQEERRREMVLLLFLKKSLKWFPFLHTDHLYELILPQCKDVDVFDKLCSSPVPGNNFNLSCSLFLPFPDGAYLLHVSQISQLGSVILEMEQKLSSIAEILDPSFNSFLVSFSGEIVERSLCESLSEKKSDAVSCTEKKGSCLPRDHTVKLSISPAFGSLIFLDVYIQAAFLPYLWGLLPRANVLFQNLRRKVSRFGNVYCVLTASSGLRVLTSPPFNSPQILDSASVFSVPYLSNILLHPLNLGQAHVTCHLMCVLSMSINWVCSFCNRTFTEGKCSNTSCLSHTGMSIAKANILVEDGTSTFTVFCKDHQVQQMLGLSPKEWDVIQNHVRRKGGVSIQHNEASVGPMVLEEHEDLFTWFLRSLCRSPIVCRSILLTFRMDRKSSKTGQLKRFISNEVEFLSQTRDQRNLVCLEIQEAAR